MGHSDAMTVMSVRISERDRDKFKAMAAERGVSVSDLLRFLIREAAPPETLPKPVHMPPPYTVSVGAPRGSKLRWRLLTG